MEPASGSAPRFSDEFRSHLQTLFAWRRDVRRFRDDPLPEELVIELLELAVLAPSVGNSQPWRFVLVEDPTRRAAVVANFKTCNADALANYHGDTATSYATLKLEGLRDAPVHLAVFVDRDTPDGKGLGSRTVAETLDYSVVLAIQTLWLAARSHHVGMGWVSILNPEELRGSLEVPRDWEFVAYLCLGYPEEEHDDPELVRHGWQERRPLGELLLRR
jgi:5,6-dimethylbenzimidazole synthase